MTKTNGANPLPSSLFSLGEGGGAGAVAQAFPGATPDEIFAAIGAWMVQQKQGTHDENVAAEADRLRVREDAKLLLAAEQSADGTPRVPLKERLLSVAGLSTLGAVEPLIRGVIYRDTLAQLSGAPGSYKSFITCGMAGALTTGMSNWEGHRIPRRAKVVYVAAEGASGLRARFIAWCELAGVDPIELEDWLYVLPCPIQLGNLVDVTEAVDLVKEIEADLLILDTRARCTIGLEENSATEQGRAIHAAETIQAAAGCTVLSVHHSSRAGTAGRGSNSWDGAVWSDLRLEGSELIAKIHVEKHKDVPAGMDYHFKLIEHVVSSANMPEASEDQRHTLVVVGNDGMSAGGVGTNLLAVEKNAARIVDIMRTNSTADGLSGATLRDLSVEDGIKRTPYHNALKLLQERGTLRNIGSAKRTHFVLAPVDLNGGDDN
ncbi:AAA family ATPase [Rhodococcoides kyotonense]|uniref:AAA domain-containing protein n=1 Tax=Rhodococcoides kyotonense TaxID=398843 RepID=A0A239E5Q2_9NOCA|nr:AAA family ATPase [Rhodococcus kyotonensis]SNS40045.1 AAA domain-containing protein [Rhodococcus kyotonensis]